MLASAEPQAGGAVQARASADVVVGVRAGPDPGDAIRTAHHVARQLGTAYPNRSSAVLLLSDTESSSSPPSRADNGGGILNWPHGGRPPLEATLRAALTFGATAVAYVSAAAEGQSLDTPARLLAPLLEGDVDLTLPVYATHRFEAVVNTAIAAPLVRALFGRRLRQPLGEEVALSRGLVDHLLGDAWAADPAHAGDHLWLVTSALAGGFRPCQAYLGPRPRPSDPTVALPQALAQTLSALFHEMRFHAAAWQRVKGSKPVPVAGEPGLPPTDPAHPQIGPLLSAFQLGYQELGRIWGEVLPPQTVLALKRLTRVPEASFSVDDALWARIVYDFAVGYHLGALDRDVLLRSMTPLYLGWVASFVREVRDLAPEGVETRVEHLCHAFEAVKPYLIQRWRWPDRFNP